MGSCGDRECPFRIIFDLQMTKEEEDFCLNDKLSKILIREIAREAFRELLSQTGDDISLCEDDEYLDFLLEKCRDNPCDVYTMHAILKRMKND